MEKRQLLLLRHGKSDWPSGPIRDFDRELKPRGVEASRRMGKWIADEGLTPNVVVSSSAARAQATAKLTANAFGMSAESMVLEPRIYEASTNTLLEVLAMHGQEHRRLLLVGHNPGFSSLAQQLSKEPLDAGSRGNLFPTAALAIVDFTGEWSDLGRPAVSQVRVVRPREL
ncbi:MAG: histidine phosphatase family protein [Chromatiales bacterium]|jgi:phosphohistidine phosphatase|nr:histidine phosphatase family protein [Chromatiales bacterium]